MKPVLLHLPFGVPLYAYGLLLTASVIVGRALAIHLGELAGIERRLADRCATWTLVGAVTGARLLYVATNLDRFDSALGVFACWEGGVVAYGGFVGGLIAAATFCRIHEVSLLTWADCVAPALCVGLALTRIGCFLGGCDFGREWNGPWAVRFPAGSPAFVQQSLLGLLPPDATMSLPVHPAQLYESLAGVVLLSLVFAVRRRQQVSGDALVAFALGYSVLRYLIEIVRADSDRGSIGPWSTSQFLAIATFVAATALLCVLRHKRAALAEHARQAFEEDMSMRSFVKSIGPRVRAGWFLPLLLLALPNCALQVGGLTNPDAFDAGPQPESSAIMCDIPKVPAPGSDGCATSIETGLGLSLAHAAVALVQGEQTSIGLDLSAAAEASCGGLPKKTEFQGPWPDGYAVCLNCAKQIPTKYADANAACVAMCVSLVSSGGAEPAGGAQAFCSANAKVATNFDPNDCYDDACSDGGTLRSDFVDPRRAQEPVAWTDLIGTSALGNDLSRISATDGEFDAGAASKQTITRGDAWVEFEATENNMGHVIGLSPDVGTDSDPSPADIAFGIRLGGNSKIVVFEGGAPVGTSLGLYNAGDRFRVQLRDNLDGTATVTYVQLNGACTPGTVCNSSVLATSAKSASYPVRVSASLASAGATLKNVTLVRIQ